ncbi:MAG: cation transporter [Bacteroidota bacterium]
MKTQIKISLFSLLFALFALPTFAQTAAPKIATSEFKVEGVCSMCKARIENAATIKGVKFAEWDKETGILKVIYKTKLTSEEAIQKAVAARGHDTENVKSSDETYAKLPGCCSYRDGLEKH